MDQTLASLEEEFKLSNTIESQLSSLEKILKTFPLLFGYWLKLITLSSNKLSVWQQALEKCPVIEIWTKYLQSPHGQSLETARKAVDKLGCHFLSQPLWDILLERSGNNSADVKKVIGIPLYAYAKYFQIAYENNVATPEKLESMSNEVSSAVSQRWNFESKLKRPYFHPRILENEELTTWDAYLTYVQTSSASITDIKQLYERCLVTTALYPDFWKRYINWSKSTGLLNHKIFTDAIHYHPNDQSLRLLYSRFLESMNDLEEARNQLIVETIHSPNMLLAELVKFDRKHNFKSRTDDVKYAIELAKQSGDLSHIPMERPSDYSELFECGVIDPKSLFVLWENGACPDSVKYASKLKSLGYLDLFFKVDRTLGYSL